ncbi:zinc ABC transporter permease AztB [Williamsia herbipolensis]|uniref:zinc ABC transporter permease AztB n=1 Tax=Williamsia herbipolensis TaxID=1603258 RepID=UPI0005F810D7|nr:zinc ABC transporter permease AztB [Williamsia herbipolensis]
MYWITEPFASIATQRALLAGILAAVLCAVAGSWVLIRGLTFLGDAMAHGMLPGIAMATLLGGNPLIGATASALAMAAGVGAMTGQRRIGGDTAIGVLFVGMLALGVVIVSRSNSFTVDVTAILFGDLLAVRGVDVVVLAVATGLAVVLAALGHRAFTAVSVDERLAVGLGYRPTLVTAAQILLLTLAVVASFHVVGTLLVFGLLIAPPAAAALWAPRVGVMMLGAAAVGAASTVVGLVLSWHLATAAGATVALTAVGVFTLSALASAAHRRRPRRPSRPSQEIPA